MNPGTLQISNSLLQTGLNFQNVKSIVEYIEEAEALQDSLARMKKEEQEIEFRISLLHRLLDIQ